LESPIPLPTEEGALGRLGLKGLISICHIIIMLVGWNKLIFSSSQHSNILSRKKQSFFKLAMLHEILAENVCKKTVLQLSIVCKFSKVLQVFCGRIIYVFKEIEACEFPFIHKEKCSSFVKCLHSSLLCYPQTIKPCILLHFKLIANIMESGFILITKNRLSKHIPFLGATTAHSFYYHIWNKHEIMLLVYMDHNNLS